MNNATAPSFSFNSRSNLHILNFACAVHNKRAELEARLNDWTFQANVEDALLFAVLKIDLDEVAEQINEDGRAEMLGDQLAYVNVMIGTDGKRSYEVGFANSEGDDSGTVCKVSDLASVDEWFDDEWAMVEAA